MDNQNEFFKLCDKILKEAENERKKAEEIIMGLEKERERIEKESRMRQLKALLKIIEKK